MLPTAEPGLHRKLVWITFFRLVMVTVLLGGTAVVNWRLAEEGDPVTRPLYAVVIATYVASLAFAGLLRQGLAPVALAYAQIAVDVAVAAAVVGVTGRVDSVFVFMFSLAVVDGAILLDRRGALAAVGLVLLTYLPVALWGVPHRDWRALWVHGGAFVATAVLATYLAEQLRRTGERLAEREGDLAAVTALHESIVQSVTSGLLTIDTSGRVTFLNRAGEQMTGLSLAQVAGRPARGPLAAFQTGIARGETDLAVPSGARLRVGYSAFPLVGREGALLGAAVIFQDLTELRAMEERVARSERLADLGRVSAGLAHELRNPLASMMGAVELLDGTAALRDDDRRLLSIVLREGGRLAQLVTDFLAFARPAPLRRQAVDLRALADETLAAFAHDPAAQGVTLHRALQAAPTRADPDQLRQVLWNLLLNAAQALPRGGDAPAGQVRVACGPGPDGGVELTVEDDGSGIAEADRERIFTPFFTTRPAGTGLGLATVHRIVDAHGGGVAVEASPLGGARFTVRLPAPVEGAPAEGTPE